MNDYNAYIMYSGRTEKQIAADNANRKPPTVVRRPSKRHQRRANSESRLDGTSEK